MFAVFLTPKSRVARKMVLALAITSDAIKAKHRLPAQHLCGPCCVEMRAQFWVSNSTDLVLVG